MYDFDIPGLLRNPVDPAQIPLATQAPDAPSLPTPTTAMSRPSLIDRVLEKLYPEGAFGGFLPPEVLRAERLAALRKAGLSLLAAGGPRPQGTRNVGADIAQAFDPAQWSERLSGVAQTGMQLQMTMQKLEQDRKAKAILAANPARPNETPQQYEQRLRRLSGLFLEAGLPDHAKVASTMISEVRPEKVSTQLTEMPDGTKQLVNSETGETIKTWAPGEKVVLTPEQRLANQKQFEAEISEYASAAKAYKTYQDLRGSKSGPVNDPIRLAAALRVIAPSMSVTPEQIISGGAAGEFGHIPFIGPLIKAFSDKGELDAAGRAALDLIVDNEIRNKRVGSGAVVARWQRLTPGAGFIYDPLADEKSKTSIPSGITGRADKVRGVLGR